MRRAKSHGDVAILYNRTASIWANGNNSSQLNGSFTHWALAHAGYDADFLAEEDVEAGQLARYKVLYLDGPQLRGWTAEAIRAWVEGGGVLFGSAGAARVAEAESPIAGIVRYDGPDRAVVFVIDHRAEPVERFTLTLADAAGFARALTATGNPVELQPNDDGSLTVALPLNTADAVVLLKSLAARSVR